VEYLYKWGALFFYLSTHSRLEDLSARFPVILLEFLNVIFILVKNWEKGSPFPTRLQPPASQEAVE